MTPRATVRKVVAPPYPANHPVARADWAAYHDAIHDLDAKAGAVLDLLAREGLDKNTIVFFFGDHGRECFRGKYFSYEQGCHTALIVRWPGQVPAGTTSDDLVSVIDVTATSLSLAGVKLPADFHGQPFLGPETRQREFVFTARDRIDDAQAELKGAWSRSSSFKPHVGTGYLHDDRRGDGQSIAILRFKPPTTGRYDLRMAYSAHETRAKKLPLTIESDGRKTQITVDQTQRLPAGQAFRSIGTVELTRDAETTITLSNTGTDGFVILNALQLILIQP